VNQGGSYTFVASPNAGKVVDEWRVNNVPVQTGGNSCTVSNIQSNITVNVTFKDAPVPTYTLTVNRGTGSGNYPAGTVITITADPAQNGETFNGWTGNVANVANVNNASTTYTMGSANATITATYRTITYTVTFDSNGGSPNPTPQTVEHGGLATEPPAPTKGDSIFQGWYDDDKKWDFPTDVITRDVTLKAKWTDGTAIKAVNPSDVVVYSQGGNLIVKSESLPIERVEVYNLSGQLLRAVQSGNSGIIEISGLPTSQVLIVKVKSENSVEILQKVLN